MPQEIVHYHSALPGAPAAALSSSVGTLLEVLDACLVDGFGGIAVTSLTQAAGVASATTSGSHTFIVGQWIEILGATPAGYVGRFKVLSVPNATAFTFAVDAGLASPAAGAITARYPPAGWNRTELGTNIKAYQSGAGSLGLWLQVEDNNVYADSAASVRARMAKDLTALDTAAALGTQYRNQKSAGGWILVADHKTVFLFMGPLTGDMSTFLFGEMTPFNPADQFGFYQSAGMSGTALAAYMVDNAYVGGSNTVGGLYAPFFHGSDSPDRLALAALRSYTQVGGPVSIATGQCLGFHMAYLAGTTSAVWASYQIATVPSPIDNTVPLSKIVMNEGYSPRGAMRGALYPLGKMPYASFTNNMQYLENVVLDGVPQRVFLATLKWNGRQLAFKVDGSW